MKYTPTFPIDIYDNGQVVPITNQEEFDNFCQKFTLIHAAGGIVHHQNDEILMIYRHELWDFPKGKVEEGEKFDETALREVQEETGVTDLQLLHPLTDTFHTYVLNGKPILKATHWFAMSAENTKLIPQTIEDITKAEWKKCSQVTDLLKDSYPSLAQLWQKIKHEYI